MRIDLVTLFPEMFAGVFGSSIIGRAAERGIVDIHYTNFRDYSTDKHRHVDDAPFGGGAGMVLKPEPLFRAVRDVQSKTSAYEPGRCTIIFDPAGDVFTQDTAKELAAHQQLILICGHYEGFDARIYDLADRIVSVGDFVLTGGEIPAMLVVDATAVCSPVCLVMPRQHRRTPSSKICSAARSTHARANSRAKLSPMSFSPVIMQRSHDGGGSRLC